MLYAIAIRQIIKQLWINLIFTENVTDAPGDLRYSGKGERRRAD